MNQTLSSKVIDLTPHLKSCQSRRRRERLQEWSYTVLALWTQYLSAGMLALYALLQLRKRNLTLFLEAAGWAINLPMRLSSGVSRFFTFFGIYPEDAKFKVLERSSRKHEDIVRRRRRRRIVLLVILAVLLVVAGHLWRSGICRWRACFARMRQCGAAKCAPAAKPEAKPEAAKPAAKTADKVKKDAAKPAAKPAAEVKKDAAKTPAPAAKPAAPAAKAPEKK